MEDLATAVSEFTVSIDTMWILVAAVLVMFMQPGFALVEAGFTRSKNTANILMKNLMDFSIGSLIFWVIGYTLMYGEDVGGFVGKISLFFGSSEINGVPDKASLMFQTVFAATAATIVSGAVAERTKFSAYLIFSIAITAVIYPISGHWVWGGGWLSSMATPFHDFAGSTVVHSVGAWVGLAGAIVIGPRIGKYTKDGRPLLWKNRDTWAIHNKIMYFDDGKYEYIGLLQFISNLIRRNCSPKDNSVTQF